ncbi:DUF485 domain-containing protein [Ammoniphilus sp. CFH 90114]|uniref:DUF485 domain-containing protein n=1 Tax=Ammoniphilus sp. CFH 90114 TaxID=2493665 RepID=UPI00100F0E45|nr:DUF485 domain-containing protein [Ammoniphilus sp. CFH 90114]RXT08765.1 DUF485 domain-containing protein [Ammoniphilus sp. CFH 90114]
MSQAKKLSVHNQEEQSVNYTEIVQSSQFQKLMRSKNAFILPMSIFFFLFYFSLPLMTSYTKVLNQPAIGPVTWAWVFAFAQFVMTWTLCILYSKKAQKFDEDVKHIMNDINKGR